MITKNYLLARIVNDEDVQDEILDRLEQMEVIISYLEDEIKKLQKPAKKVTKAKKWKTHHEN